MSENERDVFQTGEKFRAYVVERLLGNGALGAVYLVRHEVLGTRFALKVLFPDVARDNPSYVKRFIREAKIATRIRHPNLVAVHDCGYDEVRGVYFLVMDYVSGGDLRQAIAFAGHFDPERSVEVILQVASALNAAQQFHVVHRDIKPENIMIQPDGLVKLVDLGIAKADDLKDSVHTRTDTVFGTPAYVAPEQAVDASKVDTRADIYSLGVVLFEMITGKVPFDGPNAPKILAQTLSSDPFPDIRDTKSDVPPMLAALIRRMCVKERERRIPTPAALIAEFAKLGFDVSRAKSAKVEFAKEAPAATTSLKKVLVRLPKRTLRARSSWEKDTEVKAFVERLRRRRLMRRLVPVSIALAVIAVALVVVLLIKLR